MLINNEISISELGDISSSNERRRCGDRRVKKDKIESNQDQLRFNRDNIGNSGNGNHESPTNKGNLYKKFKDKTRERLT